MIQDEERRSGERLSRLEQADLIQENMGLSVKSAFLSNLRKNKEETMERVHVVDNELKSVKKDRLKELHDLLEKFHDKMERQGAILTDQLLIEEAKSISKENKLTLPTNFKFSHDWLLYFKRQRGIGQKKLHGKAGDACSVGI